MRGTKRFLLVSALLCAAWLGAEEVVIDTDFNGIPDGEGVAVERNAAFSPWIIVGSGRKISCADGVFTLKSQRGESRIFTKKVFRSGELSAKIRLDAEGKTIHYYIGFVEFQPWNNRSAWVMFNASTNGHLYMVNGKNALPKRDLHRVRTGKLEVGQWYDFRLKLDESGAELWIDGVSRGKLANPGVIPDGNMRLLFAASGENASLSLDEIKIKAIQ